MTLPSWGHFSSPLVSSVGMKRRALFLPDISLTACRYLSVLIRTVAGLVWLLPGCESNHISSSPLSLIYGGKIVQCVWGSLRGLSRRKKKKEDGIEKSTFPVLPYLRIANILHDIKNTSASKLGSNDKLFVFSLKKSSRGLHYCPQQFYSIISEMQHITWPH